MLSDSVAATVVAGLFAFASIAISLNQVRRLLNPSTFDSSFQILLHLRFYTEPLFQVRKQSFIRITVVVQF